MSFAGENHSDVSIDDSAASLKVATVRVPQVRREGSRERYRDEFSTQHRKHVQQTFQQAIRTQDPAKIESAMEHARKLGMKPNDPDFETISSVLVKLSDPERYHPTREEIISKEPFRGDHREGQLRKARTAGALAKLTQALDRFLRDLKDGRPKGGDQSPEQSPEITSRIAGDTAMSPKQADMLEEIWDGIDYDRDGLLDMDETNEILRECLSQKALSSVLSQALLADIVPEGKRDLDKIADQLAASRRSGVPGLSPAEMQAVIGPHAVKTVSDEVRRLHPDKFMQHLKLVLSLSVGMGCLELASNLHERAEDFWKKLDTDGNGEITKDEFIGAFPNALLSSVHEPVRVRALQITWEAMIAGCLQEPSVECQRRRLDRFRNQDAMDAWDEEARAADDRACCEQPRGCSEDCAMS